MNKTKYRTARTEQKFISTVSIQFAHHYGHNTNIAWKRKEKKYKNTHIYMKTQKSIIKYYSNINELSKLYLPKQDTLSSKTNI